MASGTICAGYVNNAHHGNTKNVGVYESIVMNSVVLRISAGYLRLYDEQQSNTVPVFPMIASYSVVRSNTRVWISLAGNLVELIGCNERGERYGRGRSIKI